METTVKVFIIHGFKGTPNGGWRPWLMAELEERDIYACALSMPDPSTPVRAEWVAEIARHVERNPKDAIYLVGHSLGATAILHYLASAPEIVKLAGAILVSGPCREIGKDKVDAFIGTAFDFRKIRSKARGFAIIHGDDDDSVPISHAETLSKELGGELTIVHHGGHLNGSSGWHSLPQCLAALEKMRASS